MRIILLGAPGSGKGSQARKLVERYKVPQISTGDILREAIQAGSEIGNEVETYVKAGQLVPDTLVIELVSNRLQSSDTRRGFILDGFPRTIPQAQELDTRLGWLSRTVQMVINFEVDHSTLIKRITGRQTCVNCAALFNIHTAQSKVDDVCDECGGKLIARDTVTDASVSTQLASYFTETESLTQYYRAQHKLRTLKAIGEQNEIFTRLTAMVDTEVRPLENKVVSVQSDTEVAAMQTTITGGKIVRELASIEPRTTRVELQTSIESNETPTRKKRASKKKTRKVKASKEQDLNTTESIETTTQTAEVAASPVKARKVTAKKATAKKATAKKATAKKATAKKATAKKATAKKATAKKATAKKATAKKATAKKATAKKATAKKATAKKATAKKATAKKATAKKATAKKATAKKATAKKATAKKATAKKATAKKATAKKATAKKATAKKATAKKATAKKATAKKATAKKASNKKRNSDR